MTIVYIIGGAVLGVMGLAAWLSYEFFKSRTKRGG